MLMAMQPHMADLRTWVALAVLAFVLWLHYKRRRSAKRSWDGRRYSVMSARHLTQIKY